MPRNILLTLSFLFLILFQLQAQTSIQNVSTSSGTHLCPGGTYIVTFDTTGNWSGINFVMILSDVSGNFLTPTYTSSSTSTKSFVLNIPSGVLVSNTYSILVMNTGAYIDSDTLKNITITRPSPSYTFTPNNACAGTTVNFTNTSTGVAPLSATWNFGATTGAPASTNTYNPGVSFNPVLGGGSVNYSVKIITTDVYGCKDSVTNSVSVKQKPDDLLINFIATPFVNCTGTNFLLTVDNGSSTASTNTNYSINYGVGPTRSFSSSFLTDTFTYSSFGFFNLTNIVTGINGCQNDSTYSVFNGYFPPGSIVNPGLAVTCTPFTFNIPFDSLVYLNPIGTTYTLSFSDGRQDTFFVHPPPAFIPHTVHRGSCGTNASNGSTIFPNSFQVNCVVSNPCGTNGSVIVPIRTKQKSIANFSLSDTILCLGNNLVINDISLIGKYPSGNPIGTSCDSQATRLWNITGPNYSIISGALGVSHTYSGQGSVSLIIQPTQTGIFTIRLIKRNLSDCGPDTITKTICVQPIPIPAFTLSSNNANNCVPATITATNTSNTLNSCATPTYTWSIRDSLTSTVLNPGNRFIYTNGTDSSSVNPTFRFLQKGRYVIRLRISNTCPGVFIKDTLVIIKDIPVVSLRPDVVYCGNQTLSFSSSNLNHNPIYDSSFGGITAYNWNIFPNTGFSFVSGNSNSRNPTISFTNATSLPITYRIILTATNVCGVSAPDTQNIIINPKPIVAANSANSTFCSGGNTNIILNHNLVGAVQFYWRAYPSSSFVSGFSNQLALNPGPISQTLINTGNNIETVTYKIAGFQSSTNCTGDSSTVVITVYPIPKVLASAQSICSGTILNLSLNSTVSGSLFTWTANSVNSQISGFSNNSTPVAGPIVHTLINTSNSTPDTVRYTIRASANNCNSADTVIKIRVSPTPVVNGSNQSICSANQISLNPTSSVVGSSFNYTASLINGTVTGHSSGSVIPINQTLTNIGTTIALVRYTISSTGPLPTNCPCLPVNIDVTVNPKPVLSISNSSTICSGTSTSITLNSNVTNSSYRYLATLISGTNTSGFYSKTTDTIGPISQTIYNTGTTNSVVRYSIIPIIGGCAGDTVFHLVTIIPGPIPGTISSVGPFCSGNNNFNLTLSGNTGTIVRWEKSVSPFTIYDPITNTSTTLSQSNLTQTTKYRAVINTGVGGSCGSVNTPDITVQIDSISLGGSLTGADTVCTGTNSGTIVLSGKRGTIQSWLSAPNFNGTWSNISGTNGLNSYTYSNLVSTTWYKVQVKNGVCPAAFSDSIRILVDQNPSNAIAFDTSFCLNTIGTPISGFVRANPISVGTGIWQFLSGPISSTVNQPNQILTGISNLLNGDYYYTWHVSNGKCPAKQDTAKVTVLLPIVSSIGTAQTICFGQTANLLVGASTSGGSGTYSYQWQESLDNSIYTNITGANLSNYNPGSLSVSKWFRRITNSGACTHISNSVKITVLPAIGNNSISANLSYCIGNSSNPIIGSNPSGGNGVYHFQWQKFVSGSWVNISPADTLINYSPGALTQTTDFRRIVTSDVCSGAQQNISNIVTHTVFPLPTVNAGIDFTKCNNQAPFTLTGSPSSGTWTGPQAIVANTINPTAYSIGVYPLVYTFTNSNNCTNRDTVLFSVIAPPVVNAGNDFSICENASSVLLTGFSPAGGTWSGPGVSSSGLFNPSTSGSGIIQLIYSFTAGTGCSGVDTILITVHPKPSPNFNLQAKICALDTLNLNATYNSLASINTYQWLVSNNGGLTNSILNSYNSSNATAIFPENLSSNDYTYTFKLKLTTNFGCVDSVSKNITQLRRPNSNFVTGSNINCGPASYTMSNGTTNVASNYLWSVSPTNGVFLINNNSTNPQIILPVNTSNAVINYEVKLIATRNTAELGCRDSFTAPLLVYPKPLANFTMSPTSSGCSPQTVLFTNASDPKNSENLNEMRFVWSFTGMASDTNPSLSRTFYNRTGIIDSLYNITLIGTSKWGCKDTMSSSVTVYPFPKSDFAGTNYSNCAPFLLNGTNISLTQYSIANDTYTWQILDKGMNVISQTTGTNIPTYTINQANDTVYYRLITSNVHGCKPDTLTRLFRTISNPKADFTLSDSVGCHPLNINLTSLSTVGVGHSWNFGNGSISNSINPNQIFINNSNTIDTTYQIRLVVTAGTGCTDTLKKSITVYPKPLASFILADKICALDSTIITNQSVFKTGAVNYSWTRTSPVNSLMSFSSTTVNQPSIYFPENTGSIDSVFQIRLVVTSVNSCVDDTIRPITQLRRPNANFVTGANINCGPAIYTMSNGTTNVGSTYLWSVSPTNGVFLINNNSTNPQITLPVNTSNAVINYEVKLIATRNTAELGCRDTFTAPLLVYPKPLTNFTMSPSSSGCSPQTVLFTNASDPKNSENINEMKFVWSFTGMTSDTNPSLSRTFYNRTGIIDSVYNITLIGTSKWGCKDTMSSSVTLFPFPKSDFTGTNYSNCAPFILNSSNINLTQYSIANDTYVWQILDKGMNVISQTTGTNIPTYTINQANDTVYYRLITSNVHGCKPDTLTRLFRTISNPKADFTLSDSVGCHPLNINITSLSTVGVGHSWNFGNGSTSTSINPNQSFINNSNTIDSTYQIRLVVTAGTGCRDTLIKPIVVYPKPLANFSITNQACAGIYVLPNNTSLVKPGTVQYTWSRVSPILSGLSFSDTTSANPNIFIPNNKGSFDSSYIIKLKVQSINGCIDDTNNSILSLRRPLADFVLPNPNCGPTSILVSNQTNNVSATFLWSSTPGISQINTSTSTNPNLSFSENLSPDSINYQIKLLATRTIGNCSDSITKTVTVYPKPIADFTSNSLDSCGPRLMSFTNVSNARNGGNISSLSNLWTYLNKNSNTLNSIDTFRNTGVIDSNYLVRLIITSLHGCKDTTAKTVIVRPNAKAVFTRTTAISCAPFNINSSNIITTHFSEANLLYSWYANGNFLGTGLTFPGYTLANQADSVLIKLKVSSKNNCKDDSLEMWFYTIENPKPNFIAVDSIICSGVLVQFNNTSTPINGLSYQWKYGNNLIAETIKNPANKFYNFGDLDTTIFIKLITIAGGTGCLDSIIKPIVIKPLPNPNFVFNDSIVCYPIKPNLQITSLNVPLINSTTYQWSINPGLAFVDNDTASISTFIQTPDNQSGISNNYAVKLKVASGFGCIDSISKIFKVPTRPIAQIGLVPDSSCGPKTIITNNTSSFGLNYNWTSFKNGPIINNLNSFNTGIQFPNHEGIVDSIYPIQLLVVTSEGCRDSITKPFKIFPKPIASFVTDLDSGCAPLDVQFASTSIVQKPATYSWNFGDGNSVNTIKDSALWTYLGSRNQDTTFNSILVLTSSNGCKDTISKSIDVLAGAVAVVKISDTIICSNSVNPTKLTIQNLSFGSVDTFYWDFGDGISLMTLSDSTINHPYPIEGYYRIVLKAVNTCRVSFDTAFVLVQTPPNVNFTKSDSVGCSPMKVDFVNLSTDTFRAKFLWNAGNGFTSNNFQIPQQTYLQSLTTDTFYYPILSISNACGIFSKVDTVRVLPLPTAFFLANKDSGCSPLVVEFLEGSYGVPQTYLWDFGEGTFSTRQNPIPGYITYLTNDTPTVYTIKLRVGNICGVDSISRTVKVLPNTVRSFFTTSIQFGCENLSVAFTDLSSGGPNISWNFGDGFTSSLKNPTHTYNTPGIFKAYQYVNNNCSYDTSSVVVSVFPKPKFIIDKSADSYCVLQPAQFYANLLDSGDITWYFGDGDSSNEYNPIHIYKTSGFKIVRAQLRSVSNICITELIDTVLINALPNVSLGADSLRACLNVPVKLNATANGNPFLFWDFGDGSFGNGAENDHYFLYPGSFEVKVIAVNAASCSDTARVNITIYPIPETNFDYTPKDTCTGPAWVNFTNLTPGNNTYLWMFGNGNSSTNINERQLFTNKGVYYNTLIATNIYLCKDTMEYPFTIYEKPIPRFDFNPSEICVGESIQFTNQSELGKKYVWYFGDGDSSNLENPTHIYKDSGEYYVSLLVFAGDVCFDSLRTTKKIVVYPKPNPDFSSVLLTNSKPYRTVIFNYTGTSGKDFVWTSDKGNIGKGSTIGHTFAEADSGCFKVNLVVTSTFGCDTNLSKEICLPTYFTGLFVPNAFTPDYGESKASCFLPSGIELEYYHLKIYNKWGELVWESQSLLNGEPSEAWCGDNKYTGEQCPQGSYVWTIEASYTNKKSWDGMLYPGADKKVRVGNVTLIR